MDDPLNQLAFEIAKDFGFSVFALFVIGYVVYLLIRLFISNFNFNKDIYVVFSILILAIMGSGLATYSDYTTEIKKEDYIGFKKNLDQIHLINQKLKINPKYLSKIESFKADKVIKVYEHEYVRLVLKEVKQLSVSESISKKEAAIIEGEKIKANL